VRCNTRTLYTPKPTNIAEPKTALLQYGMICHRSSLTKQSCYFEKDFDFVLLRLADTLNTQFKYREGSWHSLLKRLKYLRKSCAKFDSLLSKIYWIFKTRLHVHLKKWTLKFKLFCWTVFVILIKYAGYVDWIFTCKLCKFGKYIDYNFRDINFFLGVSFFGAPCRLKMTFASTWFSQYIHVSVQNCTCHIMSLYTPCHLRLTR